VALRSGVRRAVQGGHCHLTGNSFTLAFPKPSFDPALKLFV
jgi:hypothetical protein